MDHILKFKEKLLKRLAILFIGPKLEACLSSSIHVLELQFQCIMTHWNVVMLSKWSESCSES